MNGRWFGSTLLVALAMVALVTSIIRANNPNGTNPYWNGPSGEVVDMFSGELIYPVTDVSIPARGGMSISLTRTYNSELTIANPKPSGSKALSDGSKYTPISFSEGWHLPSPKIINGDSMIVYPNGNYEEFFKDALGRLKTRQFGVVTDSTNDSMKIRFTDGTAMVFGDRKNFGGVTIYNGRYLRRVYDNTGLNWLDYIYYGGPNSTGGLLKEIRDPEGRRVRLTYMDNDTTVNTSARIATVTYRGLGGTERTISYYYTAFQGHDCLTKVGYPNGDTIRYNYSDEYYNGNDIGHFLLESTTYSTGAKVEYRYEKFVQKTRMCPNDSTYTNDNFAVKYVIFDENGTDVDTIKFFRSYSGFSLTAQVGDSCDECTAGQKTVTQYTFYGASMQNCAEDLEHSYGLLKEVRSFKGTPSGALYQSVSGDPDVDDYREYYEVNGVFLGYGWDVATIGTLGYEPVRYPYLVGYQAHIANTASNQWVYPFSHAVFDSVVGIVKSQKSLSDSTSTITDSYYSSTYNRFLVKVQHFDGFDTRYDYDSTTTPWTPLVSRVYVISTEGTRDSVGTGYAYDAYGNVVKTWDNLSIETAGKWLDSTTYDAATHTFPVSTVTRYGLTSMALVDTNLGQTIQTQSPTGVIINYFHDNADRLTYTWRSGDADTSAKITYFNDKRVSQAQVLAVPGSPSIYRKTRAWTDIWGRTIADTSFNIESWQGTASWHKVNRYEYNRLGQIKKTFRPWRSTDSDSATIATTYKYDFLGRAKEVDSPNTLNDSSGTFNNIVTKQYFARDVTTTGWDGKKHKIRTDKYGRVIKTYFDSTGVQTYADSGSTTYMGITSLPIAVYSPAGDSIKYTYDKWRNVRSVTKKDEGTSYSYTDKLGNLRFVKDANAQWSFFQYDSLSRLIKVGIASSVDTTQINDIGYLGSSPTTKVSYFYGRYDSPPDTVADTLNGYYGTSGTGYNNISKIKGMLTQVVDEACSTFFAYDDFGRTIGKVIYFNPVQKWTGSWIYPGVKIIDYDYNVADQVESIRYPREADWIDYEFFDSGLLRRVPNFMQLTGVASQAAYLYQPWGGKKSMQFANGQWESFSYDSLSRIQKITSDADGGALAFGESYVYHNQYLTKVYADSLINTLRSGPRQYYYNYDYRGRLASAAYSIGGWGTNKSYTFDGANNRRSVTQMFTTTYNNLYSNSNRLKNTSSSSTDTTTKYLYDSQGNTLKDISKKREYRYDYRSMIDTLLQKSSLDTSKVDTLVFAYNYKNQRVMKLLNSWTDDCIPDQKAVAGPGNKGSASTETALGCSNRIWKATFYVWSGNEVVAEYNLQDELLTQYIIANGTRVARLTPTVSSKDTLYLHHDRAGSLRMVTSRTGTVVQKLSYDAFGEVIVQVGSSSIDYTYTGQDWDSEWGLNLFYLRNRYYNPSVGRFLTPDPLVSDLNPYSYCNNNPVMMSDPSGLSGTMYYTGGPGGTGNPFYDAWIKSKSTAYVEKRTINNGECGPGATDQYGNPLYTMRESGDNGGIPDFLHTITTTGGEGPEEARVPIAVQAGFASPELAYLGNDALWVLISAKASENPETVIENAIQTAFDAGDIGNDHYNDLMFSLHNLTKFGTPKAKGRPVQGNFNPKTMAILINKDLKGLELFGVFMKESFHYSTSVNHGSVVKDVLHTLGQDGLFKGDVKNMYTYYGPVAWKLRNLGMNNFASTGSNEWALDQWGKVDGCGGAFPCATVYGNYHRK